LNGRQSHLSIDEIDLQQPERAAVRLSRGVGCLKGKGPAGSPRLEPDPSSGNLC
jgi:hypothetical protein